jgi:hypothetical protein
MTNKPVYIVGKYPNSKITTGTPTCLLQAQTLGYIKKVTVSTAPYWTRIPVIDIHETNSGFQIEIDYP